MQSPETSHDSLVDEEEVELKVVIGIPAYNSERDLVKTVKPLKDVVDEIFVCDNGSTDSTLKTAKALGCKTISLPRHSEDSVTMLSLFEAALETKADVLITLAPGTVVSSSDIEKLATEIAMEHSDIVIGTNQAIGRLDFEDSPIRAYSRKAVSKMFFVRRAKLEDGRELGLEISKCEVSSRSKGASTTSQSSIPSQTTRPRALALPSSIGSFLFKNIWFWRTLLLVSGMVVSSLLLAYSAIFYYKILVLGATTSVFPWFYYVYYTNTNAALIAFLSGIVPATGALIACLIVFFKWVLPEFQISLEVFRKRRMKVPVQNAAPF